MPFSASLSVCAAWPDAGATYPGLPCMLLLLLLLLVLQRE